jgi:hypothetical protein
MRRVLMVVLSGAILTSCAGPAVTGPPTEAATSLLEVSLSKVKPPPSGDPSIVWLGALDDAVERLVPALGPAGAELGAPFRALRSAANGKLDTKLVVATRLQFDAIVVNLAPDFASDADALRITLDALAAAGAK